MSKTEASTHTAKNDPTSLSELAPYWEVSGDPSGIQKLMDLGSHGAWRLALTLPDLLERGFGAEVAMVLIRSAELALESTWSSGLNMARRLSSDFHEQQTTAGLEPINLRTAIEAIFESDPTEGQALGGELMTLVDESFSNDCHGKGRLSFFEGFACYACGIAQLSKDPRALFDRLLELTAQLFGKPDGFVNGYETGLAPVGDARFEPALRPSTVVPAAASSEAKALPIRERRATERRRPRSDRAPAKAVAHA